MYRSLKADKLVETIERLQRRIDERFPGAGLARVCAELRDATLAVSTRAAAMARPNRMMQAAVAVALLLGLALLGTVIFVIDLKRDADNLSGVLQGIEASMNILVLMGAAVFFLVTMEERLKRRQALKDLHELRAIVHVIDMHQLTKDPVSISVSTIGTATPSSPKRTLSPFELMRYLDYCAELLSLSAKAAALYGQSLRDTVVSAAVSEVEQLTSNLANKVWQKIGILQMGEVLSASAAISGPEQPKPAPLAEVVAPPRAGA